MLILHGSFMGRELLVWSEASNDAKRRARKYASPFDPGSTALVKALREAGLQLPPKTKAIDAPAWLPTIGDRPLPSSPLISSETATGNSTLEPWMVAALPLPAELTETLLLLCAAKYAAGERVLLPGVAIGEDLLYWTKALRFADSLVKRQQFLPDLFETSGEFCAHWTPVITGSDSKVAHDLAAAMPPVARALDEQAETPPEIPARVVLLEFLSTAVDYLVREASRGASARAFDSVHDEWLAALRSGDGSLKGPQDRLRALAVQVQEWRRPIEVAAAAPYRLCFRIEEPGLQREDWQVQYLLQSNVDPSLLISADTAWQANGKGPLGKQAPLVKELLLMSLAQASGICPRIEGSLRERNPSGYLLDTNGAYEFLTERAAALEQNGFGVMLPSWWTHSGTAARLTARASVKSPAMKGSSGLSMETLLNVNWQVVLGGNALSLAELRALAALKVPLVKVRGQWVQVSAEEIRAAIDFMKKKQDSGATLRDVVRLAVGATANAGPLEVDGVTASGWVGDVLAQLQGKAAFKELAQPSELVGNLRPYQVRGFSWLSFLQELGLGACLADDMGLGKTIQTLALIQRSAADRRQAGLPVLPVLLICPTSVVGNWQKEASKFTPELSVMLHHGGTRAKGEAFQKAASKSALVLSTYALLHRDFEALREIGWAGVILDEAQNIKNSETKQARAARGMAGGYRIALTGTPVENNVGDLWSIMEFLNPGLLGTQGEFKKRFFAPIQLYGDQRAAERLKGIAGPFVLRRLKTDKSIISDLPDKLEMKVYCNLTREQASLYAAVVKDAEDSLKSSEGIQRKGIVLATLSKLKQVCNHPAQFLKDHSAVGGRSGKLARLTEMLEEALAAGDRALVFTQFAEMGDLLQHHLENTFGREVLFLHGGVSKKKRDEMVERFSAKGGPSIFLLSLKAGGTGLNLVGANHVFHFDRWWNPAVENQATDRAFRIGQTRNVQVHKFVCAGTLEDKIDAMIETKKQVAGWVVGAGEGWLTELSNMELKELFALGREAVSEAS